MRNTKKRMTSATEKSSKTAAQLFVKPDNGAIFAVEEGAHLILFTVPSLSR